MFFGQDFGSAAPALYATTVWPCVSGLALRRGKGWGCADVVVVDAPHAVVLEKRHDALRNCVAIARHQHHDLLALRRGKGTPRLFQIPESHSPLKLSRAFGVLPGTLPRSSPGV